MIIYTVKVQNKSLKTFPLVGKKKPSPNLIILSPKSAVIPTGKLKDIGGWTKGAEMKQLQEIFNYSSDTRIEKK